MSGAANTPQGMRELIMLALKQSYSDVMRDGQSVSVFDEAIALETIISIVEARQAAAPQGREALEAWIKENFTGHGRAVRRQADAPIPGEPFMSMEDAKDLTRLAVAEFCAAPAVAPDVGAGQIDDLIKRLEYDDMAVYMLDPLRLEAARMLRRLSDALAQEPGEDADKIALDAAHQIEALPSDLHEAQKTARIQLIILAALRPERSGGRGT